MKTFIKEKIENFKKDDVKIAILGLSIPIGLILSGVLAYLNIDFIELQNNIFNPELLDEIEQVMRKWYIISFAIFLTALVLLVIYSICKKNEEDAVTWGKTIFLAIELILILQVVLPLLSLIMLLVLGLIYLILFSSMLLKNIIGYGTYAFVFIVEKICTSSEITLTYGEFIGQEEYSMFLTIITFLISLPYLLTNLLKLIRKFFQVVTGNKSLIEQFFKLVETIFSVNGVRYTIYIFLFFTSIFTYSVNVSQEDHVLLLVKESLLEFVILDTVIYSITSHIKDAKINHDQQKMRRFYIPFKYDLEFVLSVITMHNLTNKDMQARIKFSVDINSKGKNQKNISEINKILIDISTNYYKIEDLEKKIKEVLSKIIDLIG